MKLTKQTRISLLDPTRKSKIVIYHFYHFPFLSLYHCSVLSFHFYFTKSSSFHSVLTFHFCSLYFPCLSLCYFLFPFFYYFPFLFYFHSSFLSSVAQYWYHKHCLSLITFDHVLLTLLDNLSPYLLPIPCIIFILLICLSVLLSI